MEPRPADWKALEPAVSVATKKNPPSRILDWLFLSHVSF